MNKRVAVFVDGENISADRADTITLEARRHGSIVVQRVYGDMTLLPKWQKRLDFLAVHSGTGKNAADIMIALDALECAIEDKAETTIIASSDSDFRHVAFRLRTFGQKVIGMGETKTCAAFREACTIFVDLLAKQPHPEETCPAPEPNNFDQQIITAIKKQDSNGAGLLVSDINRLMRNAHQTKISNHPEKTWHGYFSKRPQFFSVDPRGKNARVRLVAHSHAN